MSTQVNDGRQLRPTEVSSRKLPDIAGDYRTRQDVYIETEIQRTNQAVLGAALEGAGLAIKSRLLYATEKEEGADTNEYLALDDRCRFLF